MKWNGAGTTRSVYPAPNPTQEEFATPERWRLLFVPVHGRKRTGRGQPVYWRVFSTLFDSWPFVPVPHRRRRYEMIKNIFSKNRVRKRRTPETDRRYDADRFRRFFSEAARFVDEKHTTVALWTDCDMDEVIKSNRTQHPKRRNFAINQWKNTLSSMKENVFSDVDSIF